MHTPTLDAFVVAVTRAACDDIVQTQPKDYRHRRNSGGYLSPLDDMRTSNIPFLALIVGAFVLMVATGVVVLCVWTCTNASVAVVDMRLVLC